MDLLDKDQAPRPERALQSLAVLPDRRGLIASCKRQVQTLMGGTAYPSPAGRNGMLQAAAAREVGKLQQWDFIAVNRCHAVGALAGMHLTAKDAGEPIAAVIGRDAFQSANPGGISNCFSTLKA
jgi:hypothetical protein